VTTVFNGCAIVGWQLNSSFCNSAFAQVENHVVIDRCGQKNASLSVSDRRNLSWTYCMPAETPDYCERDSILSFEEIIPFVRLVARRGGIQAPYEPS